MELTITPALTAALNGAPAGVAVEFIVTYEDGTAGISYLATTDENGAASATFVPASASTATVTAVEVLATATS
jgi:hypothetical protein